MLANITDLWTIDLVQHRFRMKRKAASDTTEQKLQRDENMNMGKD